MAVTEEGTQARRLGRGLKAGDPRARLACQLRAGGPVTVYRRGVRPAPDQSPDSTLR